MEGDVRTEIWGIFFPPFFSRSTEQAGFQDGTGAVFPPPDPTTWLTCRGTPADVPPSQEALSISQGDTIAFPKHPFAQGMAGTFRHRCYPLHSYIRSLPTKSDFEQSVTRIEKTYRQEINELQKDLGVCMEDIQNTTDGLCNALKSHEETLNSHTVMIQKIVHQ